MEILYTITSLEYPLNVNIVLKKFIKKYLLLQDNFIEKIQYSQVVQLHHKLKTSQNFLLNKGIKVNFFESEYSKFYEDALFGNDFLYKFNPDIVFIFILPIKILLIIPQIKKVKLKYLHY